MKSVVMIVDDNITNLKIAKKALGDTYNVLTMASGYKLFEMLGRIVPDIILLDVEMPDKDGYEVLRELKQDERTALIPVIFLTAKNDTGSEIEGLSLGAVDYITKPFSHAILRKRIENHLALKAYGEQLQDLVEDKTRQLTELQSAVLSIVAEIVERRDDLTGGHIERTKLYLEVMISEMLRQNLYRDIIETWDLSFLYESSLLHDVGKISIRDDILIKPGRLTNEEFELMKLHSIKGVELIESIEKKTSKHNFLYHAKIFAGTHHERWDGSGYPHGLQGEKIPLQGRIMAIVDVYDALVSERPYKRAFSHECAIAVIEESSGSHFDPTLVDVFLSKADEFKSISQRFRAREYASAE